MSLRWTRLSRWHRPVAAVLALTPPVGCAWFAEATGRWDLFERTGSITAAVGLTLASRRYLQHGIAELASLHAEHANLHAEEDIHTTKLGFALSAFGTIIWGWGAYIGWWCFLFTGLWALMALRDMWRDRHLSKHPPPGAEPPHGAPAA